MQITTDPPVIKNPWFNSLQSHLLNAVKSQLVMMDTTKKTVKRVREKFCIDSFSIIK